MSPATSQELLGAELSWVRGVIADLRDGRLTWSEQWLREIAAVFAHTNDPDEAEDS